MLRFRFRPLIALAGLIAALAIVAVDADAKPRMSSGSRGSRTYSAPAATNTAPTTARPVERSMTQPSATQPGAAARPGQTTQPGGFFNRPGMGMLGGLAAGFLGAGLLGMLFGGGFMSGVGGFASIIGLLIQVVLVVVVARLAWSWWQRRNAPQAAMAGGPSMREAVPDDRPRTDLGGGAAPGAAPQGPTDEIGIGPDDYDAFEKLLGEVQGGYSREDLAALRTRLTPEMLSYFAEELAANSQRNVVNQITDVKLLQGDLAEAWREGDSEYATVALRYGYVDKYVDRTTGRVVEGGDAPQETTEVWTFRRAHGGTWTLSAIQQTS